MPQDFQLDRIHNKVLQIHDNLPECSSLGELIWERAPQILTAGVAEELQIAQPLVWGLWVPTTIQFQPQTSCVENKVKIVVFHLSAPQLQSK